MKRAKPRESTAIVADGRERALAAAAEELAARRVSVKAAVAEKYAPELQRAGAFRCFWLEIRMQWEIQREMRRARDKVAPRRGLYAATPGPIQNRH
jgi:hypothetical protein